VEYDLIPNDNTRLLKVEAGELDVDNVLPYNLVAQVKNNSSVKVVIDRSTETNYFVPNTKAAPFGDVKVRQAITHAIDRAAIVKAVLYGNGTPANSFMPRGAIDYDPNIPLPSYDPTLARKLLSESSVPRGFTMTFNVGSGDTVTNEEAVIFKSEVAPLGIKVNIKPEDPTTLFNDQEVGKIPFTGNLWTNDIPDPDELVAFSANYASGSWNFFTWYNNPEVSRLSHEAEQTNDAATRRRLYYQIQEIWARDQWFFALTYTPFVNAVNSRVQGFHENPLGYFILQGVHKT
jgi:peptide/nickel transport system substrate-binding protein